MNIILALSISIYWILVSWIAIEGQVQVRGQFPGGRTISSQALEGIHRFTDQSPVEPTPKYLLPQMDNNMLKNEEEEFYSPDYEFSERVADLINITEAKTTTEDDHKRGNIHVNEENSPDFDDLINSKNDILYTDVQVVSDQNQTSKNTVSDESLISEEVVASDDFNQNGDILTDKPQDECNVSSDFSFKKQYVRLEKNSFKDRHERPFKIGQAVPFTLSMETHGSWSSGLNGKARVWRARIESPGALFLSINFSNFFLPPGGEFYIVGDSTVLGAFTGEVNNKPDGSFSTTPIAGDFLVLEYWETIHPVHEINGDDQCTEDEYERSDSESKDEINPSNKDTNNQSEILNVDKDTKPIFYDSQNQTLIYEETSENCTTSIFYEDPFDGDLEETVFDTIRLEPDSSTYEFNDSNSNNLEDSSTQANPNTADESIIITDEVSNIEDQTREASDSNLISGESNVTDKLDDSTNTKLTKKKSKKPKNKKKKKTHKRKEIPLVEDPKPRRRRLLHGRRGKKYAKFAIDKKNSNNAIIEVKSVVHGFRNIPGVTEEVDPMMGEKNGKQGQENFSTKSCADQKMNGDSGWCNIDVACKEGNFLRNQINSVGMLITDDGQRLCSGALINNGLHDGRQLFLTAAHCLPKHGIKRISNYLVIFNHQNKYCINTGERYSASLSKMQAHQTFQDKTLNDQSAANYTFFDFENNSESLDEDLSKKTTENEDLVARKMEKSVKTNTGTENTKEISGRVHSVQGLQLLTYGTSSDFALLEIIEKIPSYYNVFYSGWNRSHEAPRKKCSGIHHPAGDIKKISQFNGQVIYGSWGESPNYYHFVIPGWSRGAMEPGSSGSPLFDQDGFIVAHLHGGSSNCRNGKGWDLYGALFADWSAHGGLAPFLDPHRRHILSLGGGYLRTVHQKDSPRIVDADFEVLACDESSAPSEDCTVDSDSASITYEDSPSDHDTKRSDRVEDEITASI